MVYYWQQERDEDQQMILIPYTKDINKTALQNIGAARAAEMTDDRGPLSGGPNPGLNDARARQSQPQIEAGSAALLARIK